MPTAPTYPGVYIEEVPSGVRTITGVATSVAAFVGFFSRGPMNEAVRVFNFGDFERAFGGLRADSEAAYAIQQFFLNGGGQAYVVRVAAGAAAASTLTLQEGTDDVLVVSAASPGLWGDDLAVSVDHDTADPATQFNLTVVEDGGATEVFRNLVMDPASPAYAVGVVNAGSRLVRLGLPATAPAPTARPDEDTELPLTGGNDGALPGAGELAGTAAAKTGIHALLDVDLFNILCIPDTVRLNDNDANTVADAAIALCADERAFYILDVPQVSAVRDDVPDVEAWLGGATAPTRSKNAAVYFPRTEVADALNGFRPRRVAPSGTMAGVYARTDGTRGVWKAPAGTEAVLNGVRQLEYRLTDDENGVLNPLGVNALRTLPVVGNVAWGARTLDGADQLASEWKYIPIRRLALYIEESLFRGTQWVVFEPNDEKLWAQIRLNVGTFMHTLFRQGAFQGTKPQDAYFVKCDAEVNPQADIDRGIVNIVVGFAPLKPAEFVIIKLQQMAGQLEV